MDTATATEVVEAQEVDLEIEMFWLTELVNCLVRRLGGEVVLTDEEIKDMLEYDSSWARVGDLYCIKVRRI